MLDVKRNLTTMTDFYELTMSAGYLDEGYVDKIAVFDMFFRRVPDGGGYAVMAGLQQFIDAVDHLKFTDEDIEYLRSTKAFDEKFLTYLANFKLHCNIWAIEEGMPIFPQEPIVTVEGPAIECQLLETLLLVTFNHQCLIATKANRIVRSAAPDTFLVAAKKLHLDPHDCLVLEDSFNGVRAGRAAGCVTVMVPDLMQPTEEIAQLYDRKCEDLLEVRDLLIEGKL